MDFRDVLFLSQAGAKGWDLYRNIRIFKKEKKNFLRFLSLRLDRTLNLF